MNLVILGPQGCGKGTQAKLLAKNYNLNHISTGELLRQEATQNTYKGKLLSQILKDGSLVPFETVAELLEPEIKSSDTGYILDGTPREMSQAEYLDNLLSKIGKPIDKVIFLTIPDQESEKRLALRARKEGRSDDNPESVSKRLKLYHQMTEPVIDYYREQGKLLEIDGLPDVDTIHKDIIAKLNL